MATVTRNTFSNLAALETAYTEAHAGWSLPNAMEWAFAAYNNVTGPIASYTSSSPTRVAGVLTNGDLFVADGANLLGYPYTVNKLTYDFRNSDVAAQLFGAVTTSYNGARTGYVNQAVVFEPTRGSVTFNGYNDVALTGDGTISSMLWERNGASIITTTSSPIRADLNDSSQPLISGAWNSVTLTYAGQTLTVSNLVWDANVVPATASDFLTVVFGSADARFLFNHAPAVLVSDQQIGAGATVLAATLLSTSDADGDSMARYRFWDGGVGGGHFNFAGTPAAAKLNLEVAAADLASVTYTGGAVAGAEVLWAQVNDGTVWGAWQSWTQTTVRTSNVLSVVAAGTDTLAPLVWRTGAQAALTISDGDGDPAVWVEFTDLTASAGSGRLWYSGSYVAANQPVVVSGANLANFWLQGGANLGSDQVQVRVNDGYGWSTPSTLTLLTKGPNHAPAVLVSAQQIVAGATVLASTLLSTSDADGDSMARYRFWDGGVGGGHFNFAGTPAAAKLNLEVAAADLASVTYTGGAVAGAEVLWAQVNDGTVWGAWQSWTQTTVRTSNVLSVVAAGTDTLAPLVWRTGAQAALTISDGDGDPAVWVEFTDLTASAGSGRLWYSGSYVAANQPVVVSGANLANFWLQGGANLGSDQVQVRVNDGYGWSTPSTLTLLTKGPNHAPAVLVSAQQIVAGATVLASTLLSTSDADGDSMARYRFWDGGVGGGHFNFAGTPAAAKLNLEVAAADLASVTYTGGAVAGAEVLWAQVNDGTVWGAWQSWTQTTVRTSNVLSVVAAGTDTLAPLVWRTGAQAALTISDGDGDPAVWVEFTDLTASAGSGRLWYSGSYVAANQPVVVSGANLANFWLQGGANLGSDQVQVRVNDGYGWSTPSTLTLLTKGPNHAPAVLVSAQQIVAGATVLASTLLSTSDADGDSMARYRFWDGGVGGGHFNFAGTPAAAKLNLEVAAADLASVTYTGGAVAGAEVLWAQVNDGTVWGAWQSWTQTTQPMAPTAGQAVIDLGSYGKLIAPVQVDGGNWLYYWDRSGDGSSADSGSLNGGVDYASHDVLDGIFNQDINRNTGGGGNTDNTYRYATLNGVHVALPTVGGQSSPPYGANGIGNRQPATAVGSSPTASTGSNAANSTYDDYLAVWDAYNGTGTSTNVNGVPSGWPLSLYFSATPSASGHAFVSLGSGSVGDYVDHWDLYVALQVLFNDSVPVITSAASTSVAENITGTVYTVTASAADAGAVLTYDVGGVDGGLFNIDALSGVVTFKTAPNFEVPSDAGGNNVYNISVTASHGSQGSAPRAVVITVTDVVEAPSSQAGQAVIDLGAYGKLIAPVQVDGGNWFYYWDRSGDGTIADSGSLNQGVDWTNHDVLDGIFNQDINGNTGGGGDTNNTYRYATLNDVHVALPTSNGAHPTYCYYYQPGEYLYQYQYLHGTAIGSSPASNGSNAANSTYSDLLAVWDAYNGTGADTQTNGTPAGWRGGGYWSATSVASGHVLIEFANPGGVPYGRADYWGGNAWVALQVL